MRKTLSTLILSIITLVAIAQPNKFVFKAHAIGGEVIPINQTLKSINPSSTLGGELAIEFPSWGEYPWQQYLGEPTLGVGFVGLDLGNHKVLGQTFAIYPYLLIKIVELPHFELNWKIGAGLSFFNKTYNRVYKEFGNDPDWSYYGPTCNNLIGSIINVYLTTGANLNFPITKQFAIHTDLGYMHMSNGSVLQPNGGLNILYAAIGASYKLDKEDIKEKARNSIKTIVLPESTDIRVLEAARKVTDDGFAKVILIGDRNELQNLSFIGDVDIINDYFLNTGIQIGNRLMNNAVYCNLIKQLRCAIHKIGYIYRNRAELAIGYCPFPERIQRILVLESGNERLDLIHCLNRIAVELYAILNFKRIKIFVDPVAILSIFVALCMLVTVISGFVRLKQANDKVISDIQVPEGVELVK